MSSQCQIGSVGFQPLNHVAANTQEGAFVLMDFCLIFVTFGYYDKPEILRYAITSICPKGADVKQGPQPTQVAIVFVADLIRNCGRNSNPRPVSFPAYLLPSCQGICRLESAFANQRTDS